VPARTPPASVDLRLEGSAALSGEQVKAALAAPQVPCAAACEKVSQTPDPLGGRTLSCCGVLPHAPVARGVRGENCTACPRVVP
jgi:hypothetical protein